MGTLVKLAEAAVAKAEELEAALVEDYLNEVAAPEELAPVKDFSAEEVAAPVEISPVKEIAAPVNNAVAAFVTENEEVEVNAMDDADKSKETTPATASEGIIDCLLDTTVSGSLDSYVGKSDENYSSDAENEKDDSLLAGSLDYPVEESDENYSSDAGDEKDDSLSAERDDKISEKDKISASDFFLRY